MTGAPDIERTRSRLSHPAWALLFAGVPLLAGLYAGRLFIDDAFITFRYAENIAAGRGFVYNTAPLLGTTAPFYCLLLAAAAKAGVSITSAALAIGVIAAALAPLLCWRTGVDTDQPRAGFLAALLLSLFPWWWMAGTTGMETTLAGALAIAAIYFDLRQKGAASGLVSALLCLTRPDAATLPALIFLLRFRTHRREAMRFALAAAAVMIPWTVFAAIYFGSPMPQSLFAKKLIHYFPFHLALVRYLSWFVALKLPPAMALMTFLYLAGAALMARSWREGMAMALWPPVLILGLSLTRVGPFFWYKMPVVPVYFFVAAYGAVRIKNFKPSKAFARAARVMAMLIVPVFVALQLYTALPFLRDSSKLGIYNNDVAALRYLALKIKELSAKEGRDPASVKVFAGEVGVIGYELMDFIMIDSSGINSPEVYEIREKDVAKLKRQMPVFTWKEQWAGTPDWSREVIAQYRPDFIASNPEYLNLMTLARDPEFQAAYKLVDSEEDGQGKKFVLFERTIK
jgi:hypothetical protein